MVLALLACGDKDGGDDTATTATDGGTTGDAGTTDGGGAADGGTTDGGTADPEQPVVIAVDAWCYPHSTGVEDYIWQVDAAYTDPQGDDTAASYFPGITVRDGGTAVAEYSLTCPDPGQCGGSFRESQDNVRCTLASGYSIEVRVQDEDDNWSEPVTTTGRMCPTSDPC